MHSFLHYRGEVIIMDFGDAIEYPTRGKPFEHILALTASMLFSFLIIPSFYLSGYFVAVMRGTINEDSEPPVVSTETVGQYVNYPALRTRCNGVVEGGAS